MYCPTHFQQNNAEALADLMRKCPLAAIVTNTACGLVAEHIPLLYHPSPDGWGLLRGHVAKNNPLWQLPPQTEVLVIFQGPGCYISPNGYASKAEHGRVVPTWNYAVVHAHCHLQALHEPQQVLDIVTELTNTHEHTQAQAWQVSDAPADFTHRLLSQIVGIELSIHHMQGKWKMSQNQPPANRTSLIQALSTQGTHAEAEVARWMREQ
jgi:transcriptional regulator